MRLRALACALLLPSCWGGGSGKGTPPDALAGRKREVLAAVAACTVELTRSFATSAEALERAAVALRDTGSADARTAARAVFHEAMDVWQEAELFQFGPAAATPAPGARDLRDSIHAWPLVSRCAIEQQLVNEAYAKPDFPRALVSTRGLAALEYLLFHEGDENACPASATINSSGAWAALGAEEIDRRRRAYAAAAAADVAARARELFTAWDPAGGDFASELATAGAGSRTFRTAQAGLNAVGNSIFYVEIFVKDAKLARPLGLTDCEAATCPEAAESPFAGRSADHVRANLRGAGRILSGCHAASDPGIDDLLAAAGAGDLAERLARAHARAVEAGAAIASPDLRPALAGDPAPVRALHDRVKDLNDLLKTELVSVLDLELPRLIETDND